MKVLLVTLLLITNALAVSFDEGMAFLKEHMPESDRAVIDDERLKEEITLALKARETFAWTQAVPEDIFLNDVLPYAVFDETRDPWRAEFLEMAQPLVKDAKTASEAAMILNSRIFDLINVHYNTGRKRPNQSHKESRALGKATCTGLSIILVNACRSVGIPARAIGTPLWKNGRGNHTWVEIWDDSWHFLGADEPDDRGLNHGWFTNDAEQAEQPKHGVYATNWKRTGTSFPMIWAVTNTSVAAVDVTDRYAKKSKAENKIGIRLLSNKIRVVARGWLLNSETGQTWSFKTKASTADLNDMPRIPVIPRERYEWRFLVNGIEWKSESFVAKQGESTADLNASELKRTSPLKEEDVKETIHRLYETSVEERKAQMQAALDTKQITHGEHSLKWLERSFGNAPKGERSLWISMHGGGGTSPQINDQQWENQIRLYKPKEGIYVAPRAPTDTWNLWHQNHIDPLFSYLIESMVAERGVNPNKVYLMGYSAGGDGVWQLAPRMADRFAAASMMAGHPNESSLLGLRNLPFAIFMGGGDSAYDRNTLAKQKTKELKKLHKKDPDGYQHLSKIYPGLPHWMNGKDREAIPWMAAFSRNTWPKKVVWHQDDVTHDRFYWLLLPEDAEKKAAQTITAEVKGQMIRLNGDVPKGMRLLLSDELLNLDQKIQVQINKSKAKTYQVQRSEAAIRTSLETRLDPSLAGSALLELP